MLIFFWGAFHFISAVRGQAAYWLAPWLAILSYGIVFQVGLMNFYLSCGIVFWLFAILWRQRFGWRALWAAPLLLLSYLAHPLPVVVVLYVWRPTAGLPCGCGDVFRFSFFLVAWSYSFAGSQAMSWRDTSPFGNLRNSWAGREWISLCCMDGLTCRWPLGFLLFSVVLLGGRRIAGGPS